MVSEQAVAIDLAIRFNLPQAGLFKTVEEVVADVNGRLDAAQERIEKLLVEIRKAHLARIECQNNGIDMALVEEIYDSTPHPWD